MKQLVVSTVQSMSACLSVGHTGELCKTAEPIEMPFGEADLCEPKEPCIRWGHDRTNPFAAARCGKVVMRPLAELLWTLVCFYEQNVTVQQNSVYHRPTEATQCVVQRPAVDDELAGPHH